MLAWSERQQTGPGVVLNEEGQGELKLWVGWVFVPKPSRMEHYKRHKIMESDTNDKKHLKELNGSSVEGNLQTDSVQKGASAQNITHFPSTDAT